MRQRHGTEERLQWLDHAFVVCNPSSHRLLGTACGSCTSDGSEPTCSGWVCSRTAMVGSTCPRSPRHQLAISDEWRSRTLKVRQNAQYREEEMDDEEGEECEVAKLKFNLDQHVSALVNDTTSWTKPFRVGRATKSVWLRQLRG